jgi:transcriptional regulator of nitric oxide reductase
MCGIAGYWHLDLQVVRGASPMENRAQSQGIATAMTDRYFGAGGDSQGTWIDPSIVLNSTEPETIIDRPPLWVDLNLDFVSHWNQEYHFSTLKLSNLHGNYPNR